MFKLFNSNGGVPLVTISNEYQNFHLRKSGLLTEKDFTTVNDTKWCDISTKGMNCPVLVLKPRGYDYNNKVASIPVVEKKDIPALQFRGYRLYAWWNLTIQDGIEYYIFDVWQPPERGPGLKLWNNDGMLVYHSAWYRLKLVSFHELTYAESPNLQQDYKVDISAYRKYSNNLGIFIPYVRRALVEAHGHGQNFPGGFSTEGAWELIEGFFFKDENTVQQTLIDTGTSTGWWRVIDTWMTPGSTYIFMVDLDGIPLGYGN